MDWNVIATIASPVIGVFVGIWGNKRFENRPKIISYYTHVPAFQYTPPGGVSIGINTHSVVIRNIGREKATGVRVNHAILPDFNIWPSVVHTIDTLPNGSKDIVIPVLVPMEEITISYLYFQPLMFHQINSSIKSSVRRIFKLGSKKRIAKSGLISLKNLVGMLMKIDMRIKWSVLQICMYFLYLARPIEL